MTSRAPTPRLCCHLLVLALAGACCSCGQSAESAQPFAATVTLDLAASGEPVNRLILGNNVQWIDRGDELLEADTVLFAPRMLEKVIALKPAVLRYPGGCQADTYHWKNGIGEPGERQPNARFFDSRKEPVLFGTREFLELCQRTGAEPLITVNIATGTADEAAEWVAYVNKQGVRSLAGEPLPNVKYWEIGNEPYLTNEKRPELAMSPEEYVKKANTFIAKMKAVDPSIEVMIPLRSDRIGGKPATPYQGFADKVLRGIKEDFEHVAVHNAYLPADFGGSASGEDLYRATVAASQVVADDLAYTQTLLEKYHPGKKIGIAVTEHSSLFTIGRSSDGYIASQLGAIYLADLLRVLAEAERLSLANYWSLSGNWHFGAISNRGLFRPAYFVLEAYSRLLHGNLVPLKVESPTFASPAVGFVPKLDRNPLVTAIATREQKYVRLLIINKGWRQKANVKLTAGKERQLSGLSVQFLNASTPFEVAKGNAEGWVSKRIAGKSLPLLLELPAHSLAFVEFQLED